MNNPLLMLVPLGGFLGGMLLWSRMTHLVIAAFQVAPRAARQPTSRTAEDFLTTERKFRRMIFLMSGAWLFAVGGALAETLSINRTGWSLFFGGMLVAPVLLVTVMLSFMRAVRPRQTPAHPRSLSEL